MSHRYFNPVIVMLGWPLLLQVVDICIGEVAGSSVDMMLPGYLWLYADGTIGIAFDTWDHSE